MNIPHYQTDRPLRDSTLLFPVREDSTGYSNICLALKLRGFGVGRWNGAGGKVKAGESPELAARREAEEEINIEPLDLFKIGEVTFFFPRNPEWDQRVHIFLCKRWSRTPQRSEEMDPKWFNITEIPYEQMWPDDRYWLPIVLANRHVRGSFVFGRNDEILNITPIR